MADIQVFNVEKLATALNCSIARSCHAIQEARKTP